MRTILVGAVESTAAALASLVADGRPPMALVTLPLAKSGRHSDFVDLRPAALDAGVKVIEVENGNAPESLMQIRAFAPDLILVIGWSQICGNEFMAVPKIGCVGFHPSLLPANRGRGVLPWTILQGGERTGASLFWLADGADTGDLLVQRSFPLDAEETARTLMDKHLAVLPEMIRAGLRLIESGEPCRIAQDEACASWCARRTADDGWIDWSRPAQEVWTLIRAAGHPYPGAFTAYGRRKLTIWAAQLAARRPFWGLPGQIQEITAEGALVQCGDRQHVLLTRIELDGEQEREAFGAGLKIHRKLGVSPVPEFGPGGKGE